MTITVLRALNNALHQAFQTDERVLLLGEDVLDPYGGAFKVSRGLSEAFPDRVWSTPISEAGIVGVAAGMSMRGLRPVVEIMFGDFLTLAADQLINHAAKFRQMYNNQVHVPLVLRTPMGGRRGYGPTHSQTLEKHFLGAPGLRLLAPCNLAEPSRLLLEAIQKADRPTLFIENKLLYLLPVLDLTQEPEFELQIDEFAGREAQDRGQYTPVYCLRLRGGPPAQMTLAVYGYMVELARQAALRLAYEQEIFVEIVAPTQLAPFVLDQVLASTDRTQRLLTIEEGTYDLGWGAEVIAQAAQKLGPRLLAADRLAALNLPVPASGPLEMEVLPQVDRIILSCLNLARKR